ncbi:MAG: hypothetical protein SWJ54_09325 [Cyanobacteriota bacterium]|nr:hypothetical protein [Cyanobacteriota bacterium]
MIVLCFCLSIAAISTLLVKVIAPDEIHRIVSLLSGCLIFGWGFLLAPIWIKLFISVVLFAVCSASLRDYA